MTWRVVIGQEESEEERARRQPYFERLVTAAHTGDTETGEDLPSQGKPRNLQKHRVCAQTKRGRNCVAHPESGRVEALPASCHFVHAMSEAALRSARKASVVGDGCGRFGLPTQGYQSSRPLLQNSQVAHARLEDWTICIDSCSWRSLCCSRAGCGICLVVGWRRETHLRSGSPLQMLVQGVGIDGAAWGQEGPRLVACSDLLKQPHRRTRQRCGSVFISNHSTQPPL